MKKLVFVLVATALLFQFCDKPAAVTDPEKEISEIRTVLEKYSIANEKEDFSIMEEIWMPADDILLIGTDSDEVLLGWEEIQKAIRSQHGKFESTLINISDQRIKVNETCNTAWFSEELNYNFIYQEKAMSFEGIRFTGVLCKKDGKWKLVQGHLSIPAQVVIEEVR
ncbi:MAG: nuclear transport factor 2 family protein [Bacteroidetes bacterium]|nr:nuclear transport factor 2 family protein [Bacteroidota bacterium]